MTKKNSSVKLFLITIFVCAMLVLCGCSSKNYSANDSMMESNSSGSYYQYAKDEEMGYLTDSAFGMAPESTERPSGGNTYVSSLTTKTTALENAKLVYTAEIVLETTEFEISSEKLEQLVVSLNGYFENSYVNNYNTYRNGHYVIRIPSLNYTEFCTYASELCNLKSISRSVDNISESYYDNEARLVTQKTKLERLQNLLKKAENMEDIITLESAISETELAIERLTGTLRKYDSLVDFSTITLTLNEVYKITQIEQPPIGFWEKLGSAFRTGCENFARTIENTVIGFAYNWIENLVFITIFVIVLVVVLKKIKKRKLAKKVTEEKK
ncbi:MAG: DUF4349 domain-containing protein [Clostridia bacterium]|nr:DUF4349 domain-containing protein [Clostridia bacterium]